jgi:hypothetical protein
MGSTDVQAFASLGPFIGNGQFIVKDVPDYFETGLELGLDAKWGVQFGTLLGLQELGLLAGVDGVGLNFTLTPESDGAARYCTIVFSDQFMLRLVVSESLRPLPFTP